MSVTRVVDGAPLEAAMSTNDAVEPGDVRYLVFDVEAVADGELISRVRYPGEDLSPGDAIARYREELMAASGRDVIPPTWMLPVSVAVGKVSSDCRLLDLTVLDPPNYRPEVITRRFWQGWKHYGRPILVTFNGRGYDLPVLEMAAYRYGISVPAWFNVESRSWEQSRNRYNIDRHIDLQDLFTNFGAIRLSGGLNLMASLIGKPGKMGVDGSRVQPLHDAGRDEEINDYCRCDVLDTYFVFLRSRVLLGNLTRDDEQAIIDETVAWLKDRADSDPAWHGYLDALAARDAVEPTPQKDESPITAETEESV